MDNKTRLAALVLTLAACSSPQNLQPARPESVPLLPRDVVSQLDWDGDGIQDIDDPCPGDPANDADGDGHCNLLAADLDGDGCVSPRDKEGMAEAVRQGLLSVDFFPDGRIDLSDVAVYSALVRVEMGQCTGIWKPRPGVTWQWQLQGNIDTSIDVEVFDIDLFDVPLATIEDLHAQGKRVIAYFSAGSVEDWREDAVLFPPQALGNPVSGWPGERWLDVRSPAVRAIMLARLDLAAARGFDAVEPDNVDAYQNGSGFPLTEADQIDYLLFLAEAAHERGLSIGLKNAVDLAETLEPHFDWALNEECLEYDECDRLLPFVQAGKAVLHVEYADQCSQLAAKAEQICGRVPAGFSTLVKTWDLETCRVACDSM